KAPAPRSDGGSPRSAGPDHPPAHPVLRARRRPARDSPLVKAASDPAGGRDARRYRFEAFERYRWVGWPWNASAASMTVSLKVGCGWIDAATSSATAPIST